jgi:outer membrane lipoprotein-sorting protein
MTSRLSTWLRCAALLCLMAGAAPARADQELTPADTTTLLQTLHDRHEKAPSFQATFTEQRTSHLLNKPVTSTGSVAFSVPDKFRREVRTPSPSTTISNGRTMWIYYPSFNEVEEYSLAQRSFLSESLDALTAFLNFEHIDEYYALRAYREPTGYRLDLTPKKPSSRRMVEKITLDLDANLIPTRTDILSPKGDEIVTDYHGTHRPSLPDSTFEFTPPPGAIITRPMGK